MVALGFLLSFGSVRVYIRSVIPLLCSEQMPINLPFLRNFSVRPTAYEIMEA